MIRAMAVLTAEEHPNADRLRVYTLSAGENVTVTQVCANLTNVYQVGDIVAVCEVDHDCGDFTIAARKVRGVLSEGMMIGTVDATVGQDVTEDFTDFEY
jgi:phenylalanyl-tRNA synthetase beta chain